MKVIHYDDYRLSRAVAYPSAGDQLDALWKLINALDPSLSANTDAEAMRERIKSIKAAFPKPPGVE